MEKVQWNLMNYKKNGLEQSKNKKSTGQAGNYSLKQLINYLFNILHLYQIIHLLPQLN